MAGGSLAALWTKLVPYYTKAHPDVLVGLGFMTILYYKISYGGKKKAVQSKPAH